MLLRIRRWSLMVWAMFISQYFIILHPWCMCWPHPSCGAGTFLIPCSFYWRYPVKNRPGHVWVFFQVAQRNTMHQDADAVNTWTKTLEYAIKHLSVPRTQPQGLKSALRWEEQSPRIM